MEIRKLGLEDVFYLSEIIDKMGVTEQVSTIMEDAMKQDDPQAYAGGQLVIILMGKLHKAKDVVFEWFASIHNIEVEDAKKLGFMELKDTFNAIIKNEDIGAFFNSLVKIEQN